MKLYLFHIRCGWCPDPHAITLCEAHAKLVVKEQPEYYDAEKGQACQICDMIDQLIKDAVLNRVPPKAVEDVDGLFKLALGFTIKGGRVVR